MNGYIKAHIHRVTEEPALVFEFYREFLKIVPILSDTRVVPVKHKNVRVDVGGRSDDYQMTPHRFTFVGRDRNEITWEIWCVQATTGSGLTLFVYDSDNVNSNPR